MEPSSVSFTATGRSIRQTQEQRAHRSPHAHRNEHHISRQGSSAMGDEEQHRGAESSTPRSASMPASRAAVDALSCPLTAVAAARIEALGRGDFLAR